MIPHNFKSLPATLNTDFALANLLSWDQEKKVQGATLIMSVSGKSGITVDLSEL